MKKSKTIDDPKTPLTEDQIRTLTAMLCDHDEPRAAALLVLVSDMRERESAKVSDAFPYWLVRQIAFSQCGNDAIDAQVQLIRSELL